METYALVDCITGEVLCNGFNPSLPQRKDVMVLATEPNVHLKLVQDWKKGHFVRIKPHNCTAKLVQDGEFTIHEKRQTTLELNGATLLSPRRYMCYEGDTITIKHDANQNVELYHDWLAPFTDDEGRRVGRIASGQQLTVNIAGTYTFRVWDIEHSSEPV